MRFEAPAPRRHAQWREHYRRYAAALGEPVDDATADAVWAWLLARTHGVEALLAIDDAGELAGFAHFRPFPRTLHGNVAGFLDDLWVTPEHRGSGLAEALIEAVCAIARERGWTELRWVTDEHNAAARRLYDRVAVDGRLATYRIRFSAPEGG